MSIFGRLGFQIQNEFVRYPVRRIRGTVTAARRLRYLTALALGSGCLPDTDGRLCRAPAIFIAVTSRVTEITARANTCLSLRSPARANDVPQQQQAEGHANTQTRTQPFPAPCSYLRVLSLIFETIFAVGHELLFDGISVNMIKRRYLHVLALHSDSARSPAPRLADPVVHTHKQKEDSRKESDTGFQIQNIRCLRADWLSVSPEGGVSRW